MVRRLQAALAWLTAQRNEIRLWGAALTVLAATLVAGPASAYSIHVEWNAPAGCPDVEALRGSVEQLLGEPLLEGRTFEALATVTADLDARFTLTLDMRTPE